MLESQDVWQIFNNTIRMMNDSANVQYFQTVGDINATQAAYADPDQGAYNMTMGGMNTIHDIQSAIINPLSQLKTAYDNTLGGGPQPVASLPQATAAHGANAIGSLVASPGTILPTNDLLFALLCIVIGVAIGGLIFNKK